MPWPGSARLPRSALVRERPRSRSRRAPETRRSAAFNGRYAWASALIVRWYWCGPVSMPRISQASEDRDQCEPRRHASKRRPAAASAVPGPWLALGWSCHAGRPHPAPAPRATSKRTTTARVTSHVISAAGVARWKPLTQPHHAHAARTATPRTMRWRRTGTGLSHRGPVRGRAVPGASGGARSPRRPAGPRSRAWSV